MRYVGVKFTKDEWNSLVDAVIGKRSDIRLTQVLREALMEMSEEEMNMLEVEEVDGKGQVVVKSVPIDERLHAKVKKVARKRGVQIGRLLAAIVMRYWSA